MERLFALGLVGNMVQVVDFTVGLIPQSSEIYRTGDSTLVGAPVIRMATTDLKLLSGRLELRAKDSGDAEMARLCQLCNEVAD